MALSGLPVLFKVPWLKVTAVLPNIGFVWQDRNMEEVCGIAKGRKIRFLSPLLQIPSKDFSAAAVSIARTMVSIIEPITRYPQKSAFRPPPSAGLRKNPEFITFVDDVESEVLALKHESMILGQWSNPVSGSRKSQARSTWA